MKTFDCCKNSEKNILGIFENKFMQLFWNKPLLMVRMAPGRYVDTVKKAGGLTKRMREELKLPADCPRAIEKWHNKFVTNPLIFK